MIRALAIADDLTGAAEIAAVGHRCGLPARVAREPVAGCDAGLTVLDTDSRLLPPGEAARVVRDFIRALRRCDDIDLIYKKTDSVLRGPVRAELDALRAALDRPVAVLLPQNPSRGRVIEGGEYRIDGTPLHLTPFAADPDHPRTTSDVLSLLGGGPDVCCNTPTDAIPSSGIIVGAAGSEAEVRRWAALATTARALPAGGADFFRALLEHRGLTSGGDGKGGGAPPPRPPAGATLFICGSTADASRAFVTRAAERHVPVCPMPAAVFRASDAPALREWADSVRAAIGAASAAVMAIRQPLARDPRLSRRLEAAMAEAAARVLGTTRVANVLIDGGSTASAVCRRMGWRRFDVRDELAPGAVRLTAAAAPAGAPTVCVKPGSYSWPECVWPERTAPREQ